MSTNKTANPQGNNALTIMVKYFAGRRFFSSQAYRNEQFLEFGTRDIASDDTKSMRLH